MTRKGKHRTRLNFIVSLLALILIAYCVLSTLNEKYDLNIGLPVFNTPSLGFVYDFIEGILEGQPKDEYKNALEVAGPARSALEVHFIDVGQGESILILGPKAVALIDCGENDQGTKVLSYLKSQKVTKIDYLIGTHPHSDHIGGMDTIIDELEIGRIIMPDIPDSIVPTTKTYTDVLMSIAKKGLKITPAKPGEAYDMGDGAKLTILAPEAEFGDMNNISVVTRLQYEGHTFLFTGDIEAQAEESLLASGQEIKTDVLNVAHHGSITSTTPEFSKAAAPRFAVISCGIDNSYGHPQKETVQRLKDAGAEIYRTDLDGHIVITFDGKELRVNTQK